MVCGGDFKNVLQWNCYITISDTFSDTFPPWQEHNFWGIFGMKTYQEYKSNKTIKNHGIGLQTAIILKDKQLDINEMSVKGFM